MVDIATNEPFKFVSGDRLQWKRSFSDYPASTWTLAYTLLHATLAKITITASADGDDHSVDESAATTAAWAAGTYNWKAFVTNVAIRHQVDEGQIIIEPDYASLTNYDARVHAEKVLAAIEAVIEGRATKDQESYTIEGRTLQRTPIPDLIVLRDKYKAEVGGLRKAERIANGLDGGNTIKVRF